MAPMSYRPLGHTDCKVSVICLGTMTWGQQNTEVEAHAQLDRALELGVNFIDTAEVYPVPIRRETHARTETYIGNWLETRKNRENVVLATKVAGASGRMDWLRGPGHRLDRKNITAAIDTSLQRLKTDYVDLYQLHWPDRTVNIFGQKEYVHNPDELEFDLLETLSAMDELVKAGKVRYIGLSNETPWGTMRYLQLAEANGLSRPVSIQNAYNLLNRTFEIGLAEVAHRETIGLLAYSPLAFGVLSGKYLDNQRPEGARMTLFGDYFDRYTRPQAEKATRAYVELAHEHGLKPAQLALAYINSRPFVTSNIIGATNLQQLEENIASADVTLEPSVLKAINAIHEETPNPCP